MERKDPIFYLRLALFGVQLIKLISYLREMAISKHVLYTPRIQAGSSRLEPHAVISNEFFKNQLGLYIYTRQWFPSKTPTGVVFLIHGFAEHCGRYNLLAQELTKIGLAVFALDHQGHGRSEGTRAHVEKFNHYVDDVIQYIDLVFNENSRFHSYESQLSSLPRFILGHSMGGLIATLTVYRLQSMFQSESPWHGVILSGPALMPDPKTATPVLRGIARFISNVLPKLPISPLDPNFVSRDPQIVEIYRADPLNYSEGARARWATEMLDAMDEAMKKSPTFTWPYLLLQGGSDRLCNAEGAKRFHAQTKSEDKSLQIYPNLYHEIFNEVERDEPIRAVVQWIIARLK